MTTAHTETVDKYLEAIYYIDAEGEVVRPSRLAYWLSVSAPTVSNALVRLKRDGWIDVGSDRSVTLTESGRATATSLVRRHRILERWLT
ncbi:MAG TPA: metal-dependent transcriptional regulator, partial [Acidimicrobiales bacterium]|nr:metal-dependent transcriptional regulator [Acidimicrobiales bacterium]